MKRVLPCCLAVTLAACSSGAPVVGTATSAVRSQPTPQKVPQSSNPYTLFESLQTRPLALSPDGQLLFAANTPDNRLEVFRVKRDGLHSLGSVAVGLEPVAVAVRDNHEAWVVNHLSDSVSIVRVDDDDGCGDDDHASARVVRTLLVGDEPRDLVFAGPHRSRAFITTAHRGQNSPDDPDLFNSAAGRADVWVFDADHLGHAAGGTRLTKITLFADTPRALAASADGKTVYAAAFFSGNQTTLVSVDAVRHVYASQIDPNNANIIYWIPGIPQPITGLVVKYKNGHWLDAAGKNFDAWVTIKLPDNDVFAIDATANPPVAAANGVYQHVGTTLFNAAVNPVNGKVYVSNTDAHNDVRFEGHNKNLPFSSVRGNIVDSRITVIDPASGSVTPVNLNPHLVHSFDGAGDASLSRAFPQDLVVSRDGKKLYVVAQGSAKLAIYDTADLEAGAATPTAANQVNLAAGGPTGVVVDERRGTAYVLTRFDNGISTVDLRGTRETAHVRMYNPEPASVTDGRRYLYDATFTSKLGDQACASCHIGGDFDGLAWDLGNPGALPLAMVPFDQANAQLQGQLAGNPTLTLFLLTKVFTIPPPIIVNLLGPQYAVLFKAYQPLKGPMTTQSLRGLDNHGPMHWRGDRNGSIQQEGPLVVTDPTTGITVQTTPYIDPSTGKPVITAQPDKGMFDEQKAFESFNVAFPGLVGRDDKLDPADMTAYANFALQITYPPNPIRALDDSLTPEQTQALAFYHNADSSHPEIPSDRFHNCNGCHTLDRNGNAGQTAHPGFFGTDGKLSFENVPQVFKVAHLRNLYQKIGMWGSSPDENFPGTQLPHLNPGLLSPVPSVRGFGFQHDGASGPLDHFFTGLVFINSTENFIFNGVNVGPNPGGIPFVLTDPPNHPQTGTIQYDALGPIPDPQGVALRHALLTLLFAFDTNMYPIVGQQVTVGEHAGADAMARVALFETQADAGHCDLVVKARSHGREVGYVYANHAFVGDRTGVGPLAQLPADDDTTLTFTAVPPGSGWRIGVDRDGDGWADGDEVAAGTDPSDATSHP